MAKETLKQQLFREEYLRNGGNGVAAARFAGYKGTDGSLRVIASENLTKLNIAAAVQERVKQAAISADEVLALLTDHAHATIEDFVNDDLKGERVKLDMGKAKARGKLHLVKSLEFDQNGNPKLKLHDAQAAVVQLGRYHGLFTDVTVVRDHAEEWAAGFVGDVMGVLREHITDEGQLDSIIGAIESRIQARLGRGGVGVSEAEAVSV